MQARRPSQKHGRFYSQNTPRLSQSFHLRQLNSPPGGRTVSAGESSGICIAKERDMHKPGKLLLATVIGMLGIAAGSARADDENEVKIKFADAPVAVQKTLQQESGGAKIDELTKETEG